MPELPEVETVARQINPSAAGRKVKRIEILDEKLSGPDYSFFEGLKVIRVFRHGKEIVFAFSAGRSKKENLWLSVHLRMTGRLIVDDGAGEMTTKGLRATIVLDKGKIHFYDTRRFGVIKVIDAAELPECVGLDPTFEQFTDTKLAELLAGSKQEIKSWLLRQDRLVGMGNIYASEALFEAKINPFKLAGELERPEVKRLRKKISSILAKAIENCGTTFSDFQDASGRIGSYQRFLKVYGKTGEPCPSCKKPIASGRQQGRSTFYCPSCQSVD